MNRIAAASGAFNALCSISCMLIIKHIWTCHVEFALYKLIIIIIITRLESCCRARALGRTLTSGVHTGWCLPGAVPGHTA